MNESELREQLHAIGASDEDVSRWIADGLPHKLIDDVREYNPDQVAAWLLERGHLVNEHDSQSQTIVRTIPEVANHFGVSINAVSKWCKDPEFPGKAGERGRQNGRFPLEAIAAWRDARDGNTANQTGNTARERKWLADAEIRELELARLRGELIEVAVVAGEMTRSIYNAKSILGDLPDHVADEIPNQVPEGDMPALRRRLVKIIRRALSQAYDSLADMAREAHDDETQTDEDP